VSAFLTAYDLAERTERNEPEHHDAGETFAKPTRVPREVKTLDSLSDKEVSGMAGVKNRHPAWGKQRPCTYVIPTQKNILFFPGFLRGSFPLTLVLIIPSPKCPAHSSGFLHSIP